MLAVLDSVKNRYFACLDSPYDPVLGREAIRREVERLEKYEKREKEEKKQAEAAR